MSENALDQSTDQSGSGPYRLPSNTGALIKLALGSAGTISTLIVIPDAIGLIPIAPSVTTWLIKILGLWLSAYILWFISFLGLLYVVALATGGMVLSSQGLRLWCRGKLIPWSKVKAITVDKQPLFSAVFFLKSVARKLIIYEEEAQPNALSRLRPDQSNASPALKAHPLPSFQFSSEEFVSLFAHACKWSFGFVPHSIDSYAFLADASQGLRAVTKRAVLLRVLLTFLIAFGLVSLLGRRSAVNYYYNSGTSLFRKEHYLEAAAQYGRAAKIDPTFAPAWDSLARSELRLGRIAEAEKHWHKALQMKPDFLESKLGLSNIYVRRGQLDQAKQLLDHCARLAPHTIAVYLNQADLYIRTGDPGRARDLLSIVTNEAANDPDALCKVSYLYLDLHEPGRARQVAARAAQLDPANEAARRLRRLLEGGQ